MTPLIFVLAILAGARTWRLLNVDDITFRLRDLIGRNEKLWEFWSCRWCFGYWIAFGWVGSGLLWGHTWEWQLLAGSLAANWIAALSGNKLEPS